ncbi:DUF2169 domain-containing protein [Polyangium sorediatum]
MTAPTPALGRGTMLRVMDVLSYCPLRVAALPWQPRPGSHALTVVCKATFELGPGESPLAKTQEDPAQADVHWNDDPRRSLRVASDLVPFKRRAEVLVLGHAFAPTAAPVTSVVARIAVGSIDKAIEVHADRAFTMDGRIVVGEPFLKAPLVWERAAGGANNPSGIAPNAPPDARGFRPVPSLVPRGFTVRTPADSVPAMGFGPLAPASYPRASLLGRYASTWDPRTWNTRPLFEDFDGAYFNAAPTDQQLTEFRGDETIVLEHLHSSHPRLTTKLAKVQPKVAVMRESGEAQEIRLRADTLCIDTDRALATLVWRGVVLLEKPDEAGTVMVTMVGPEASADIESTLTAVPTTAKIANAPARPALPFMPAAGPPDPAIFEMGGHETSRLEHDEEVGTGTIGPWTKNPAPVLPFQSAAPPPIVPPPASVAVDPVPFDELPPTTQKSLKVAVDRPLEAPRPAVIAPPAMIGPLAKPAMPEAPAKAPPPEAEQANELKAEEEPKKPAPPPAAEEPPADLTIEKTAAIAAEIAEGRSERVKILEAHGLKEGAWKANELRWNKALEEEPQKGKSVLRGAYDGAYVAQVEKLRGPIAVGEYARISVALERGGAKEALDALKIQQPALMPIVRVWAKRVAKDMKLGEEARKAVREARRA